MPSGWCDGSRSLMSMSRFWIKEPSCSGAQSTITVCWEAGSNSPVQGDTAKTPTAIRLWAGKEKEKKKRERQWQQEVHGQAGISRSTSSHVPRCSPSGGTRASFWEQLYRAEPFYLDLWDQDTKTRDTERQEYQRSETEFKQSRQKKLQPWCQTYGSGKTQAYCNL